MNSIMHLSFNEGWNEGFYFDSFDVEISDINMSSKNFSPDYIWFTLIQQAD